MAFHDMAWEGHSILVKSFATLNPKLVHATDMLGETALHGAARGNHVGIAKFLVNKGAEINPPDEDGATPLDYCDEGSAVYKYLRSQGAIKWEESIFAAAGRGDFERVKKLVHENPALVHAETNNGDTALHRASDLEIAKFLIESGADVNAKDWQGRSVLHHAIEDNEIGMVKLLIESGADINSKADGRQSPLDLARRSGNKEMLALVMSPRNGIEE